MKHISLFSILLLCILWIPAILFSNFLFGGDSEGLIIFFQQIQIIIAIVCTYIRGCKPENS